MRPDVRVVEEEEAMKTPSSKNVRKCATQTGWIIPNLIRGLEVPRGLRVVEEPAEMAEAGEILPVGAALGEFVVSRHKGGDATHDHYIVTHAVDGHDGFARVIKRSTLAVTPKLGQRMVTTGAALAGFVDAHLVEIVGVGVTEEEEPRPFVISERLVGRDLATYVARHGRLPWALALEIGRHCAAGLATLHARGWVHADVRAENVMLTQVDGDGFRAKLLGFDLACRLDGRKSFGVDVDLYALGVMLYQLIAGSSPLAADPSVVAMQGYRHPAVRAFNLASAGVGVPVEVAVLVGDLTNPRAEERPESAEEVLERIETIFAEPQASEGSTVAMLRRRVEAEARPQRRQANAAPMVAARAVEFGQRSLRMTAPKEPSPLAVGRTPGVVRAMCLGMVCGAVAVLLGGAVYFDRVEALVMEDPREVGSGMTLGVRILPDAPVQASASAAKVEPQRKVRVRGRVAPKAEADTVKSVSRAVSEPAEVPEAMDPEEEGVEAEVRVDAVEVPEEELLPMIGIGGE